MAVSGARALALIRQGLLRFFRQSRSLVNNPLILLLLFRFTESFVRWWARRRQLLLGRLRVLGQADAIDTELVQGCLLSAEHLLTHGRVEKRTLFIRSFLEVLGNNQYLHEEIARGARLCRSSSRNCMVMRWLPADERYHALQSCLNSVSSLFGSNYVHFNALGGENSGLFRSTWFCLTLMTPTRPENKLVSRRRVSKESSNETITFTDMTRTPRPSLRIVIVNESELRGLADGKLSAPSWGFFNSRHAERFRMLEDFARNFQHQLARSPADSRDMCSRSPFTSEKVLTGADHHHHHRHHQKPDGGFMKRVHSQPNLAHSHGRHGTMPVPPAQDPRFASDGCLSPGSEVGVNGYNAASVDEYERHQGAHEENCFLRLHVAHYTGPQALSIQPLAPAGLRSHGHETGDVGLLRSP